MKRIGEILVENGWVPAPVLARALAKQREIPRRLCSLLIAAGVLEVDQASRALGEQLGVAAVLQKHLDHRDRSLAALIPAELARAWWVLPIGRLGNGDLIVCARDPRPSVLAALQAVLTETIILAVAPASQVETLVGDAYGAPEEDFDVDMTTGPIASLDLDPMPDDNDPMRGLGNLELVQLDDAGVTRDPNQSGLIQVGAQRNSTLPSAAGIRVPPAEAPLPRPTLSPVNVAPSRPTLPPPNVPRPELVVIDPPTRPPVKRAPTEPAMIVDRPPSAAARAEDAARPVGKSAAEQAAELAARLPAEPAGAARLLARPEAVAPPPPVVIRPRTQTKPPATIAVVDDGWESPDVDARPPASTTVPPLLTQPFKEPTVPPDGVIRTTPATPLPALTRRPAARTPLPRVAKPADDPRPLKKPPPVHAVTRAPIAPPSALPSALPSAPPTSRIDPDVIAAAYAVPPPAYDPNAIAAGTVRPQRKLLAFPASLPDTLTALAAVTTRDAATAAGMRFAQGRWRAALLLQVKERSALGEAGHGNLLTDDVVASLAIPLAAPSIVSIALEARALTTNLPRDDSPVQDRLDRLLGMPRFPAAAPIMLAGYPAFVLVIGDPTAEDTDAATGDLDRLATALAAAYARVTPG